MICEILQRLPCSPVWFCIRDTAYFIVIQWSMTLCFIESQWNMPYPIWNASRTGLRNLYNIWKDKAKRKHLLRVPHRIIVTVELKPHYWTKYILGLKVFHISSCKLHTTISIRILFLHIFLNDFERRPIGPGQLVEYLCTLNSFCKYL